MVAVAQSDGRTSIDRNHSPRADLHSPQAATRPDVVLLFKEAPSIHKLEVALIG